MTDAENREKLRLCKVKSRAKNKAKSDAYEHAYYIKNKVKRTQQIKAYRENNIEQCLAKEQLWRDNNKEKARENCKTWRELNPGKARAIVRRYQAQKLKATMKWADNAAIDKMYILAAELSKQGETYHVDHIIPLKGKNVCGLHVEHNLQVIPALENIRKSNKFNGDIL